ncbi:hypothetical protein TeGR_g479 [Tetraparma gracilis]|uniref:EF-hand domain-containing protein n=1 Tax=Tetraparma gracilis TaxID=2962635 RepID=A0ABQ6N0U5_9STRA|nr:hypothetical protein TeGR_g479 [Tetraparma gracilis]
MPSPLKGVEALSLSEMQVSGKKKDHPSISDYYRAQGDTGRPLTYQHGLSNFSSVQLGDDRVSFKKSVSQDVYKLDTERQQAMLESSMEPAAATKSPAELSRQYKEATELVGEEKINHMEQMMRDKLQQRTKTGPFQLRKTFKYFDRDGSGGIDFDEFQRAMELMGFQFNEMQQLALFARYDESCTGDVDYTEFVNKLMESDFKGVASSAHGGRLFNMVQKTFSMKDLDEGAEGKRAEEHDSDVDSDLDEEERDKFRKQEVKKIFMMLDDDNSGDLDKREVNLMMLALGRQITRAELDRGWETIDSNNSGTIDFEEFYEWYVSVAR